MAVDLQPPGLDGHDVWPYTYRQLLDVVIFYCIVVGQFMGSAFPPDWNHFKADWANYTRDLVRGAPLSLLPAARTLEEEVKARNAFCAWAVLTRCFFCGLNPVPGADFISHGELEETTRWLHRVSGEFGLRDIGPTYRAWAKWVRFMPLRLATAFPQLTMAQVGGVRLLLEPHGRLDEADTDEGGLRPIYPYHFAGGYTDNRVKLVVMKRRRPVIRGSCGVPKEYYPAKNCAVGYIVASSVIQAFIQADKAAIKKLPVVQQHEVLNTVIKTVLKSDTAPLDGTHAALSYPSSLAACVGGWQLALLKVPPLVTAADDNLTAAGLTGVTELLMPKQMALPNTERCLQQLLQQMSPEALVQLLPGVLQALRDDADPALREVGRLLGQNPLQPQVQPQQQASSQLQAAAPSMAVRTVAPAPVAALLGQNLPQPQIQPLQTASQSVQQTRPPQQVPPQDGSLVGGQDKPRPQKRQRRSTALPQALVAPGSAGAAMTSVGASPGAEICGAAAGGGDAYLQGWLGPHSQPPAAAAGAVGTLDSFNLDSSLPVHTVMPYLQRGQLPAVGAPAAGAANPQVVYAPPADAPPVPGGAGGSRNLPELAAPTAAQGLPPPQQCPGSAGSTLADADVGGGGLSEDDDSFMDSIMEIIAPGYGLACVDAQPMTLVGEASTPRPALGAHASVVDMYKEWQ